MNPKKRERATDALRWAAQLAAWADDDVRPIRNDVIFHPDTVEDYLEASQTSGVEDRSLASEAALLRGLSRTVNPGLRAHRHVVISRPVTSEPYTAEEIDTMLALSRRQNTAVRRRYSLAMISLGLCLGLHGGEYPSVQPDDVVADGVAVQVSLQRTDEESRRVVVALPQYAHLLGDVVTAAVEAGDTYLLGGQGAANRTSAILGEISNSKWPVPIDVGRMRATYLVALADQRHTIGEFLELAGLSKLSSLDRYLPFIGRADRTEGLAQPDDTTTEVLVEFLADAAGSTNDPERVPDVAALDEAS